MPGDQALADVVSPEGDRRSSGRTHRTLQVRADKLSRGVPLKAYVFGIIAAGVAVAAYSVYDLISHPVGLEWLILVALTVASGWATLRIPAMPISFSISDTFNIAAALLFGPSAGAITRRARRPRAVGPHG